MQSTTRVIKYYEPSKREQTIVVLSYCLTILRVALAWFIFNCLIRKVENSFLIVVLLAFIVLLDHMDGKVFEMSSYVLKKNLRATRRVIDSVSDRACVQLVCVGLLIKTDGFELVYTMILIKECITAYYCIIGFVRKRVLESNGYGKVSTVLIAITIALWVLEYENHAFFVALWSILFGIVAMTKYRRSQQS